MGSAPRGVNLQGQVVSKLPLERCFLYGNLTHRCCLRESDDAVGKPIVLVSKRALACWRRKTRKLKGSDCEVSFGGSSIVLPHCLILVKSAERIATCEDQT